MIGLAVITGLIVLNGLFVAMEFAIVGSRLSRLSALSAGGGAIADRLEGAEAQDRYVAVAQLGITIASIGLGMYGEHKIAMWIEAPLAQVGIEGASVHVISIIAAVVIMTYFHVVFGEMIPKALALKESEKLLLAIWPIIRLFEILLRPAVWLLNVISQSLLSLFGLDRTERRAYSPRELASIAQESSEGGAISATQAAFIQNIVALRARCADELMTPRRLVVTLDLERCEKDEDLGPRLLGLGPSRIPVTRGGLDRTLGVVHVKDVIAHQLKDEGPLTASALRGLVRPLPKVLGGTDTARLVNSMRRHGTHMALVADEYGSVLGTVAFEDAIEEIVGDVRSGFELDDYEIDAEGARSWTLPGTMPLARLDSRFGWSLKQEGPRTLAGLLIDRLRRLPDVGDTITVGDVQFRVESMEGLLVDKVHAERRAAV